MPYQDHFIYTNRIRLHFIEYRTKENLPPLLLLHGLTANAHTFDGLIYNGLADKFHLYIPDLRGRGHSDKPSYNYRIRHHAKDVIGMMDQLGLKKVMIAGHSFGGLLGIYLAVHFPERRSDRADRLQRPTRIHCFLPQRIRISPARPAITHAVPALQRSEVCRYPKCQ